MGIYAPPQDQPATNGPNYGRWKFKVEQVVKWNCVFRVQDSTMNHTGDYSYHLLVPIGTLEDVASMLRKWSGLAHSR